MLTQLCKLAGILKLKDAKVLKDVKGQSCKFKIAKVKAANSRMHQSCKLKDEK